MSLLTWVMAAPADSSHVELPMPSFMFGVVALVVLLILAVVTWSYRDVANRHSQVSGARGGDGSGHGSLKDG